MRHARTVIDSFTTFYINYTKKIISPHILEGDRLILKKYYNLIGYQFIFCSTSIIYTIDSYFKDLSITTYSVMASFFLSFISLMILLKTDRYKLASHIAILASFLTFYFANYAAGFKLTSQLSWFFLFPLIPTVLLGKIGGASWTLVSIVAVVTTIVIAHNSPLPTEFTPELLYSSTLGDLFLGPILVFILTQIGFGLRERTINELEQVNKKLNETYKEKQVLLSILFHDLNNHLAVISGNAQLIEETSKENISLKLSARITKSIQSMNEITNNVKLLERIRQGKIQLTCSAVDVFEIFKEAQVVFKDKLDTKNITLEFENKKELSSLVFAEKVSLTNNIFYNIISNAIKFSYPSSKIVISIISNSDEKVIVMVEDEGIGIPKQIIDSLFSFTKMTTRQGADGESGAGFGLPILQSTIFRFNGSVDVISQSAVDGHQECFTKFIMTFNKPE